ncbi:IclR family transcriptional regulator [Isoptericola sp. NPDC057559]|uniref:IclR family transcriptional regulator n=1 Tax=Isoptericola sp. NPDC057559 TaxID=3346168 RepID=UPI0036BF29B2
MNAEISAAADAGESDVETGRRSGRVQSVDRAVALLRAVARAARPGDATVAALAATCGLNRATAWRILTTLEAESIVACDRRTGQWQIGVGLVELAGVASVDSLVGSARPVLERLSLQTGETAALAVFRADRLTYVDEVAPTSVVAATWKGRVVPLHATSTGKALLAFLPAESARTLLGGRLKRYTDSTITDRHALDEELELTRRRGFGVCRGEFEASAFGVSAPVLDSRGHPLALVSVWGPGGRLTEERFEALGEVVRDAAETIARPRSVVR